ncbi:Ig-like domain-containing protein [Candidatus Palauibacter sp.]|uniref:Ig-like domain-containing protein n=1 Tax=Candidatus Palauibacter sp. TaxID=3101350 RepID=UPI003CC561B3
MAVIRGQRSWIDARRYFSDPDRDPLTYGASSSNKDIATTLLTWGPGAGNREETWLRVTGVNEGTAMIRVTASDNEGLSVHQTFAVDVVVPESVTVTPQADTLLLRNIVRLRALASGDDGQPLAGAEFRWVTLDSALASVNDSAFVRALSEGTAIITATAGGVEGTAAITVVSRDRAKLVSLYRATGGPNWTAKGNWLTDAPLARWDGVLSNEEGLVLWLTLEDNGLDGSIPPEMGGLTDLNRLALDHNRLRGSIPRTLGELSLLSTLTLSENALTGPIPPQLGRLSSLRYLSLESNQLTGSVPPEVGSLVNLRILKLSGNPQLRGALPASLANLPHLEELLASNTGLCAPSDPDFLARLEDVRTSRVARCDPATATAYLTQAVQSREFPVPLVAGDPALLRVFVTAADPRGARMPPVRARFYLEGEEVHIVDIPGTSTPPPTDLDESDLDLSANAEIPGRIVQSGLEMVIEVDPDDTLAPGIGVTRRIPETGRLAADVRLVPSLDLTLIPFVGSEAPDSSIVDVIRDMAAAPGDHELLRPAIDLLPVGGLSVTLHEPVLTTTRDATGLVFETEAIRVMEGADGHYMGMMSESASGASGAAVPGGRSSFSVPDGTVMAHEFGHNFGLGHAPCDTADPDLSYPFRDGAIGAWGYDVHRRVLVPPETSDLMSFCDPRWIGDYHFTNALRYRRAAEEAGADAAAGIPGMSLLLWGGADAAGVPHLRPVFVVEAPPALPRSRGDYEIRGRRANGETLFSLRFDMPQALDGDGRSGFAFTLPVRAEWAGVLASVVLTGPGGTATLDEESERTMIILRDRRSGQIRGILDASYPETRELAEAAAEIAPTAGVEVLKSRGIPRPEAWR